MLLKLSIYSYLQGSYYFSKFPVQMQVSRNKLSQMSCKQLVRLLFQTILSPRPTGVINQPKLFRLQSRAISIHTLMKSSLWQLPSGIKEFSQNNEPSLKAQSRHSFQRIFNDKDRPEDLQKILSVGRTGKTADSSIPQISDTLGRIRLDRVGDYYLLIHFSNFHWKSSGIGLRCIGNHESMSRSLNIKDLMILWFLVCLSLWAFTIFLSFIQKRRYKKSTFSGALLSPKILFCKYATLLWFPMPSLVNYEILQLELALTNRRPIFFQLLY